MREIEEETKEEKKTKIKTNSFVIAVRDDLGKRV